MHHRACIAFAVPFEYRSENGHSNLLGWTPSAESTAFAGNPFPPKDARFPRLPDTRLSPSPLLPGPKDPHGERAFSRPVDLWCLRGGREEMKDGKMRKGQNRKWWVWDECPVVVQVGKWETPVIEHTGWQSKQRNHKRESNATAPAVPTTNRWFHGCISSRGVMTCPSITARSNSYFKQTRNSSGIQFWCLLVHNERKFLNERKWRGSQSGGSQQISMNVSSLVFWRRNAESTSALEEKSKRGWIGNDRLEGGVHNRKRIFLSSTWKRPRNYTPSNFLPVIHRFQCYREDCKAIECVHLMKLGSKSVNERTKQEERAIEFIERKRRQNNSWRLREATTERGIFMTPRIQETLQTPYWK